MIDVKRRLLLKYALGAGAAGMAAGAGLISVPAWAESAESQWPKRAFKQKEVDDAIEALYGQKAIDSDKIKLRVPTIAENGAVVPVKVEADLPDVSSISLMVPKNPYALTASFEIPEGTLPYVSNRLKMAETSDVIALVKSGDKLYRTSQNVKVTIGGCGG